MPKFLHFNLTLLGMVVLFSLPSILFAATFRVPTDSATVQGAVNLASDGDTVLIEDSGTYVESVALQKVVTVMAAPGQTPTLLYDSADPTPASFMVYSASPGAQFGSNAGGRITLDGACNNNVTRFMHSNIASGEVVFENLRCINSTPSAQFLYPDPEPAGTGANGIATYTFNNVIGEGVGCNLSGPTARFDDPDFLIRPDFLEGSTINLIDCEFTGADRMCILHGGGDTDASFGTINITRSILTGRELAITSEPERALPITWNVVESYLESTIPPEETAIFGSFSAWWVRAPGQIIGATRSVLLENGTGRAFYPWFPGDDSLMTFDHCDIISATNIAVQLGPPTLAAERILSFRNCNIVAADSVGFFGSIATNDTFINDYNNVVGGFDGLEASNPDIQGPNDVDPPIEPDYIEPMADGYNFEYTDGTLLTSDEFGGPVGSFQIFGAPPAPTPTPIPAAHVREWNLYQ